jgi:uncharacterized membrane protein YGL010W
MRTADAWLQEYAETHQNPVNIRLHSICVPLIYWSIFALLRAIPTPAWMAPPDYINWATLGMALSLIFYLSLGLRYFLAMLFASALVLVVINELASLNLPMALIGGTVFVVAWIGQFYGHHVEGKKPAFFHDVLFLLIGPLWVLRKIKKATGLHKRSQP